MKALSIRQPWAWAILHAGKDIENRDWKPANPGLRFRGRFVIHASARRVTRAKADAFRKFYVDMEVATPAVKLPRLPRFEEVEFGGIVGVAEIVDVVGNHASPWFFGPCGLVLQNVTPLKFVPFKGALGFFDVPDEIVRQAEAA